MYVRNTWYVAAWHHDLKPGVVLPVSILDEPIVIWSAHGRLVAFEDRCPHRLAPLSLGRCEGPNLRCMYHGMLFDSEGTCIEVPGQPQAPPAAQVRTYPVAARHGWIWVWMGDPAGADAGLIPDCYGLDDPTWMLGSGQLDFAAEARLINDNLLDLSHVSFVHAASIQGGPEFAESLPKWETLPNGLRYSRWMVGTTRPSGGESRQLDGTPVDEFLTYDFLIPGILLLYNGLFEAGTAAACGFGPPDRSSAIHKVSASSQAVTPTGKRSTRYFFSAGPRRDLGTEADRDAQVSVAQQAFEEDRRMIEAQQAVIDRTANPTVVPTAHDRSVTIFNRMVERFVRQEQAQV